ncbi:trace amine-associated receptor 13c-like [Polypterus senegalus]|uniref:trace amine-associated receptor 13c-like n=1 Tax=Polypterus senegalus TaxID=55291 RepID=UPI0019641372|nr:trace amine-associated receptor 13c-like [Polypterus senegalus]
MNVTDQKDLEDVEYCFLSGNLSCPKEKRASAVYAILYTFFIGGILMTVCGNLVVIISIIHFKNLHTPTNLFVMSLAVADFLLGAIVMPFSMVRSIETCWYFGDSFCVFHSNVDLILSTVSVFHLMFIAVDRYYAVSDPLLYVTKITMPLAWFFIVTSWTVAVIYVCIIYYFKGNTEGMEGYDPCPGDCIIVFNSTWGTLDTIVTFFLPCSLMLFLYTKIFIIAKKHQKVISTIEDQFQPREDTTQKATKHKDKKATKTLTIVIGIFILCWLPYFVNSLMDPFLSYRTPPIIVDALQWLGYFNSGFNPIIYGLFYPWFQRALKLIVTFRVFSTDSSLLCLFPENN